MSDIEPQSAGGATSQFNTGDQDIKSCKTIVDLRGVLADIFCKIGSFKLSVESKFESLTTTLSNIGSKVQQVVWKVDEVEKRMVVNEEKMVDLERNYAALTKRISELDHANLLLVKLDN